MGEFCKGEMCSAARNGDDGLCDRCRSERRELFIRNGALTVLAGSLRIKECPDGTVDLEGHPELIAAIGLDVAAAVYDGKIPPVREPRPIRAEDLQLAQARAERDLLSQTCAEQRAQLLRVTDRATQAEALLERLVWAGQDGCGKVVEEARALLRALDRPAPCCDPARQAEVQQ